MTRFMKREQNNNLVVQTSIKNNGLLIVVDGKPFPIIYPQTLWNTTPQTLKEFLRDNLSYATTIFLPLLLCKSKIDYKTPLPLLESFFYKNYLLDLLSCEYADDVPRGSYVRDFYNLDISFADGSSILPSGTTWANPKRRVKRTAILPFTFGKESLVCLGLCLELGIRPILLYCQEPAHPYEEQYKRRLLRQISKEYGVDYYFIKNGTGLLRYGKVFDERGSELGWGAQTTILAFLSLPVAYAHKADYVLFGSEISNNDAMQLDGWRAHISYDQTSFWTAELRSMIRLVTGGTCAAHALLEPIDEINIFFILAHRYPHLLPYVFSCHAKKPLYKDSQWCHACNKCERLYAFARCFSVDPKTIGFKKDLFVKKDFLNSYFSDTAYRAHYMDMVMHILRQRGYKDKFIGRFEREIMPTCHSWSWHKKNFVHLKEEYNLPTQYREQLKDIFNQEFDALKQVLP